jgi:hypothetical protein
MCSFERCLPLKGRQVEVIKQRAAGLLSPEEGWQRRVGDRNSVLIGRLVKRGEAAMFLQ